MAMMITHPPPPLQLRQVADGHHDGHGGGPGAPPLRGQDCQILARIRTKRQGGGEHG